MVGWNACGTGGKGEAARRGGGGEGNLRPSARGVPAVARSSLFCFAFATNFSQDDLKNCETILPLPLPSAFYPLEPRPAVIHFFALPEMANAM